MSVNICCFHKHSPAEAAALPDEDRGFAHKSTPTSKQSRESGTSAATPGDSDKAMHSVPAPTWGWYLPVSAVNTAWLCLAQALLTSRSGLWGFISSTAWPFLTSITWESPSQATCSIFPRMKVTTPVVPQRRLWIVRKKPQAQFWISKQEPPESISLLEDRTHWYSTMQPAPREEQAVLSTAMFSSSPSRPQPLNKSDQFYAVTPLASEPGFRSWALLVICCAAALVMTFLSVDRNVR